MRSVHAAFSARGLDADAFARTTVVKFAAFRNDDCGRSAGIEIAPAVRPWATWLCSSLAPR